VHLSTDDDDNKGPYDELILIPGLFDVPHKADTRRRITRIYVSQNDTVWNGRHNWNIPKHLARFDFANPTPTSPATSLKVYPPTGQANDDKPFFSCTLAPFRYLPSFPLSSKYMPLSTTLAQPPLPSAPVAVGDVDGTPGELLTGTEMWRGMPIDFFSPSAKVIWATVDGVPEEDKADAVRHWPVDAVPWKIGAWVRDATFLIPEPVEWKAE
jgi:hypothetical protein